MKHKPSERIWGAVLLVACPVGFVGAALQQNDAATWSVTWWATLLSALACIWGTRRGLELLFDDVE